MAVLGLSLAAEFATAETTQVVGSIGANGADGGALEPGEPGGAGGAAVAVAESQTDQINQALATGGKGGDGGDGGDGATVVLDPFPRSVNGQPGGAGGAGGDADARAAIPTAASRPQVNAFARGGVGGEGGLAGAPDPAAPGPFGQAGDGGAGGDARAEVVGDGTMPSNASLSASAIGGDGGRGQRGGAGGDALATADLASAETGISLRIDATGGQGGGDIDSPGSQPGNGGTGRATARTTTSNLPNSFSPVTVEAVGGIGGARVESSGAGGVGGLAHSELVLTSTSGNGRATSIGGQGGRAEGVGSRGGTGGAAEVVVSGSRPGPITSSNNLLTLEASAVGGRGGAGIDGAFGGDGADVVLVDAVSASEGGKLTLTQSATGGSGGSANSGAFGPLGMGGRGGNGESRLSRSLSADQLILHSRATGGEAGRSDGLDPTVAGGRAIAVGHGVNPTGSLDVDVRATGGNASDNSESRGGDGGRAGDAIAIGTSTTVASGRRALVDVQAVGGQGGDSEAGRATVGGAASADATATALGDSAVSSTATANAGSAGTLRRSGSTSQLPAEGEDGGTADARATGSNTGAQSVTVAATASGGAGTDANGADRRAGDGGSATARASGSSARGSVAVTTTTNGGQGGAGKAEAAGGDGGDAIAIDTVTGSTQGRLVLSQTAAGGRGGDGATGGRGGAANSSLNARNLAGGDLVLNVAARAGAGGSGDVARGASGDVRLAVIGESAGDVTIDADASLGAGSALELGEIRGRSTGAGDVRVGLVVDAFAPGQPRPGSAEVANGLDIVLRDAISGETDGNLDLWQRAVAGIPLASTDGRSGDGGAGESHLSGVTRSRTSLISVDAYGGDAADENSLGPDAVVAGRGGDAIATADYANEAGTLKVTAGARAGDGGAADSLIPGGDGGDATVRLDATALATADVGLEIGGVPATAFGQRQIGAFGGDGAGEGNGGRATSESRGHSLVATESFQRISVRDYAQGGLGGARGGRGGDASSHAEGTAIGGREIVVDATAIGGRGSAGGIATARAHGESTGGGAVIVKASQRAGDFDAGDLAPSAARAGTDSIMLDAVSGSTAGRLELEQSSTAGSGASRRDAVGDGGQGGRATSHLTRGNDGGGTLQTTVVATGGQGGVGAGSGHSGGVGGDGIASVEWLALSGGASLELRAKGGNGGWGRGGAQGGEGGRAGFGDSKIVATPGFENDSISVFATAEGGDGGSEQSPFDATAVIDGGSGGSIELENAIQVLSQGNVRIEQTAIGGDGGRVVGLGTSGAGGNASSAFDLVSQAGFLTLEAHARAGTAAESERGRAGDAGIARSTIRATATSGSQVLTASAVGGGSGITGDGSLRDRAGDGVVDVFGLVEGDGQTLRIGSNAFTVDHGATGGSGRRFSRSSYPNGLPSAGDGGNATSRSEGIASGDSDVYVADRATGGEGGSRDPDSATSAGTGGDATSTAIGRGEGSGIVSVLAEAFGGLGGTFGTGAERVVGGAASATATGASAQGGRVDVEAVQTAGSRRESRMANQVSGSTSGWLTLIQRAIGGESGGFAESILEAVNAAGGHLTATAESRGGAGDALDAAGDATARIAGLDDAGADLHVLARATGGSGNSRGGRGGVARASATGRSSAGGDVTVEVEQIGGSGGATADGADSTLVDAASGETTGMLVVSQTARGGAGGATAQFVPGIGRAGNASSTLHAANPAGGSIDASSVAIGGRGASTARVDTSSPGPGSAFASGRVEDEAGSGASLLVRAEGGNAGLETNTTGAAADGGVATLGEALATSDGGDLRVEAILMGGDGGRSDRGLGGRGADAHIVDVARAETSGAIALVQRALGGDGGASGFRLRAGDGGDASSALTTRVDARSLDLTLEAIGGNAGDTREAPERAHGGSASVRGDVENLGGSIVVYASASGGSEATRVNALRSSGPTGGDAAIEVRAQTVRDGDSITIGRALVGAGSFAARAGDGGESNEGLAFPGGDGGHASSRSEGIALGDAGVRVFDSARGGDGERSGQGLYVSGSGGNAESFARGVNHGLSTVEVESHASGGRAGQGGAAPYPVNGSATSIARAEGGGRAVARASAGVFSGTAGQAIGRAVSEASATGGFAALADVYVGGGPDRSGVAHAALRPTAGLVVGSDVELRSRGAASGGERLRANAFLAGRGDGIPESSVADAFVLAEIDDGSIPGAAVADIDIVLGGAGFASTSGSQEAVVSLALGTAGGVRPLALRFGPWTAIDEGIESIEVEIARNGATVVERIFTDVTLALAFLNGARFELGDRVATVDAAIRFRSSEHADRLTGGFMLVVVPEPTTALLLFLGLGGLGLARRGGRR